MSSMDINQAKSVISIGFVVQMALCIAKLTQGFRLHSSPYKATRLAQKDINSFVKMGCYQLELRDTSEEAELAQALVLLPGIQPIEQTFFIMVFTGV